MKDTRTPLDELSKDIFNSESRLAIAAELLRSKDLVTVRDISHDLGLSTSTVHTELNFLVGLGLLQRIVPERTVYFQRLEGPYWEWCQKLITRSQTHSLK
jgi:predicted transcriptional regulator